MQRLGLIFSFAATSLLGLLAIVVPVWVLDLRRYTAPLFPLIRSGVEGISLFRRGSSNLNRDCHGRVASDFGDRGDEHLIHNTQSLAARIHHLWRHQSVCGCWSVCWTVCEAPSASNKMKSQTRHPILKAAL